VKSRPVQMPSVTIEEKGPSTRTIMTIAVASATVVLSIAVGVAVWRIASGIQWAVIILAAGYAGEMLFIGWGICRHYCALGQAARIEAEGKREALITEAKAELANARRRPQLSSTIRDQGGQHG
jgi:hypothetical protein